MGGLAVALSVAALLLPAATDDAPTVTVMTRNLYLGADVGPAMDLLPDFGAATEFMWGQVRQTDFPARAQGLAREVAQHKPDVIALQEATRWVCTPHVWQPPVTVYDFTAQFLAATADAGVPYEIAAAGGRSAVNPGFAINPIAGLTMAHDPEVFRPLFGTDDAACGFRIADALLVRRDLAGAVQAAGTSEFTSDYTVIPTLMNVYRGYAWAALALDGVPRTWSHFLTTARCRRRAPRPHSWLPTWLARCPRSSWGTSTAIRAILVLPAHPTRGLSQGRATPARLRPPTALTTRVMPIGRFATRASPMLARTRSLTSPGVTRRCWMVPIRFDQRG